jgi:CheY-like chemotaxis protein
MEAAGGREALEIARRHEGVIDLLLSDISMPGELNGVQLAERLVTSRPAIKVLLMSGYSPEDFQLAETWSFLPKPFSPAALLAKIQEMMGSELYGIPVPEIVSHAGSVHR